MHAKAIEIAWHEDSSIWSLHLSPANRLVTAGGDKVARVWKLHANPITFFNSANNILHPSPTATTHPLVEWLCDLRAHTTTVNVARFTQDGLTIATGADQGEIVLWRLDHQHPNEPLGIMESGTEKWTRYATLRAHVQDVLDLAWSRCGTKLVSASVDNAIMIWDVKNPSKSPVTLRNHANFVQGVAIDPFSRLIASMGNDRTMRIFTASNATNWYQVAYLSNVQDTKLFMDDARFKNCFRRLAWSPDGSVVACPSGVHLPVAKRQFAVHIFARNQWLQPAVQCGGLPKPAVAVRFSPILYELRYYPQSSTENQSAPENHPFAKFTYRMIFAVLCVDRVLFYDTQNFQRPFASVKGLHVAENTDLTWSSDGKTVAVSSADGYVGLICFTPEELGQRLSIQNTPPWLHRQEDMAPIPRTPSKTANPTTVTVVRPQPSRSTEKTCMKSASSTRMPCSTSRHCYADEAQITVHPKSRVSMVNQSQSHQDPAMIATKSSTTAQGFRIALTNPVDKDPALKKSFRITPVTELACIKEKAPAHQLCPNAVDKNGNLDGSDTKHQLLKPSRRKASDIVQPSICSRPTVLSQEPKIRDDQNDTNPLTEVEERINQSTEAKFALSSPSEWKEQPAIPTVEGKAARAAVIDSTGKEIRINPEGPVKHKVVTKTKSTQRGSPSQSSKRRSRTKHVQTTLSAFQNPVPATVTSELKVCAENAANLASATGSVSLQKRPLPRGATQDSCAHSPFKTHRNWSNDDDEQRKRQKTNPSEVIEIS